MSYLIISCSLHPASRSRILAKRFSRLLTEANAAHELIDLRDVPLPLCDGAVAYGGEHVEPLSTKIAASTGIVLASPVYNYDLNAAAKNLLELTGRNWIGKTVGFLLAAGGRSSYMSAMGFANSLMLDFRCVILPRFVYADGTSFDEESLTDPEIEARLDTLARSLTAIAPAVAGAFRQ